MVVTATEACLSSVLVIAGYGKVGGQGNKGTTRLNSDSVMGMTRAAKGRRGLFLYSLVLFAPSPSSAANATASQLQKNDDSRTALLQKYLKKSEVNKAKNDKERLDDYYKRNYKDYFDFFEGSIRGKTNEQLSEAEKGILNWLETNK
ncbi:hypothetical protein NE237_022644 [Protea cynaroides]|uniref:Uncharacterized protein n=1 Tax=Protea cynaroides TaxID=273540 RepID=A0A9Q0K5G9_9MAGN|nr:hypothetical protein NE237_022644 [Protea cynaroides]